LKDTVIIIKASSWKSAKLSMNHPEYASILKIAQYYGDKYRFVLVGTSGRPINSFFIKNNILAWDVQASGRLGRLTYYLGLLRLLFQYRPRLVIVLGLHNILPVSAYSLLSWRTRYVPVFIGEFGYYGNSLLGKLMFDKGLLLLKNSLELSHRRTLLMFALSSYILKRIEKLVPELTGNVALISYPIHPTFCETHDKVQPKSPSTPVLLTVAGIEPRKGLDTLVAAASSIQGNFKILIKGSVRDAGYFHKLKDMISRLGLENKVVFDSDLIDYDALASYYKSATLFVFPTREDCLGVAVLEALHCGLPVIATAVGGVTDMIVDGRNGLLVQPDNPEQLSNAISSLLKNEDLRKRLASNGRKVLDDIYYKDRLTLDSALSKSIAKVQEGN